MGETQDMYDEICDGCEYQDSCDGDCTPDDCAHGEVWKREFIDWDAYARAKAKGLNPSVER